MRVLITAGPTREPLDAVRFLSNRSSGTLGFALAQAAVKAGHDATLLLGPVTQPSELDPAVNLVGFDTVDDLQHKLETHFPDHDVLIMAAAVGDYRLDPATDPAKQGKTERKGELTISLVSTPDVVAGVAKSKRDGQAVVAFALEDPAVLEQRAVEKMERKGVDAIVANPLSTMDAADIDPVLFTADGGRTAPGPMSKTLFAAWLVEQLATVRA